MRESPLTFKLGVNSERFAAAFALMAVELAYTTKIINSRLSGTWAVASSDYEDYRRAKARAQKRLWEAEGHEVQVVTGHDGVTRVRKR